MSAPRSRDHRIGGASVRGSRIDPAVRLRLLVAGRRACQLRQRGQRLPGLLDPRVVFGVRAGVAGNHTR
ncbi:MAG: hypothetical protein ACRDP8_24840, partial [Actinopolymorphaceae bacterium]